MLNPLDDKGKICNSKPNMCSACKSVPKSMINDWVQDLKVKLCSIGVFLQNRTISSSFVFLNATKYCAMKLITILNLKKNINMKLLNK